MTTNHLFILEKLELYLLFRISSRYVADFPFSLLYFDHFTELFDLSLIICWNLFLELLQTYFLVMTSELKLIFSFDFQCFNLPMASFLLLSCFKAYLSLLLRFSWSFLYPTHSCYSLWITALPAWCLCLHMPLRVSFRVFWQRYLHHFRGWHKTLSCKYCSKHFTENKVLCRCSAL